METRLSVSYQAAWAGAVDAWRDGGFYAGGVEGAMSRMVFTINQDYFKSSSRIRLTGSGIRGSARVKFILSDTNFSPREAVQSWARDYWQASTELLNSAIATPLSLTGDLTYDFYVSNLQPGKTYYLYMMRSGGDVYKNSTRYFEGSELYLTYDIYNPVTSPNVNSSSTLYPLSKEIPVSWSGGSGAANNPIVGYKVALYAGGSYVTERQVGVTSSYSFPSGIVNNFARGSDLTAKVMALGQHRNGEWSSAVKIGRINRLPVVSVQSQSSSILQISQDLTFVLNRSDPDGEVPTLSYEIDDTGWKNISGTSLTLSVDASRNIPEGPHTIYFRAWDGREYSASNDSATFEVKYNPIIDNPTMTGEKVSGKGTLLVKRNYINFQLRGDISQLRLELSIIHDKAALGNVASYTPVIVPKEYYTYDAGRNQIAIETTRIPSTILPYGDFFKTKLKVINSSGLSSTTEWLEEFQRPKLPSELFDISVTNDSHLSGISGALFRNYMNARGSIRALVAGQANVENISFNIIRSSEKALPFLFMNNVPQEGVIGKTIKAEGLNSINAEETVSLAFIITDSAGQKITQKLSQTMKKVSPLAFAGSGIEGSRPIVKPLSDTSDYTWAHPHAVSSSYLTSHYAYFIGIDEVGEKNVPIKANGSPSKEWVYSIFANQIITNGFKEVVQKNSADNNTNYEKGYLRVQADNGFEKIDVKLSLKVAFIEAPVFPAKDIKIYHSYDIAFCGIPTDLGEAISPYSKVNDTTDQGKKLETRRIFNPQEGIVFAFPIASDKNQDIVKYEVYMAKKNFVNSEQVGTIQSAQFDSLPILSIGISELQKNKDANYYYYKHIIPESYKNSSLYFKIRVVDSKNEFSEKKVPDQTFIICGRVTSPVIQINNLKLAYGASDNFIVTGNLNIQDLGAITLNNKWDSNHYNSYPNFERTFGTYQPKIGLEVQVSESPNFTEVETAFQFGSGEFQNFNINFSKAFINFKPKKTKLFVRFRLIASYGIDSSNQDGNFKGMATVQSGYSIFTFFGDIPTVSYRPHRLGVNNQDFSPDDILIVENFGKKRYVQLKGADLNRPDIKYQITIDLCTGNISGATINGGSW